MEVLEESDAVARLVMSDEMLILAVFFLRIFSLASSYD